MLSDLVVLNLLSVFTAFFIDINYGDPDFSLHPIRLIGNLISKLESILYKSTNKLSAGFFTVDSSRSSDNNYRLYSFISRI